MSGLVVAIHCTLQDDGQFTFDGNVAVASQEKLLMAIPEERITRKKYDGAFRAGLEYCLRRLEITIKDVEAVVVSTFGQPTPPESHYKNVVIDMIRKDFGFESDICFAPSHHECHAIAAAALSPYDRAIVAVVDNEGSIIGSRTSPTLWRNCLERTSFYLFENRTIRLLSREHDGPGAVGLGKAYSKVTRYIGFESYLESGKTMGLAPFGAADPFGNLRLFHIDVEGKSKTALLNTDDGLADLTRWFLDQGISLPPPRKPGSPIRRVDADLASWIQQELELVLTHHLLKTTKDQNCQSVCMTGGVAMNSVVNSRLATFFPDGSVFVPPAPGDSGIAVGAAAWYFYQADGNVPRWPVDAYAGGSYSMDEIYSAIDRRKNEICFSIVDAPEDAAKQLDQGRVIGWFQGASEYGPRALGNRSILANPSNPWIKEIVNNGVKRREWFRPFAPAVLYEHAVDYFSITEPEPFMMKVATATESGRRAIPSCIHVDGSARLQTVSKQDNALFSELLQHFMRHTGVPVVLNTSFNLAGEPIVESPSDALDSFLRADWLDVLYLNQYRVTRSY